MSRSIRRRDRKLVAMARKRGFRSVLCVPLMREGVAVGMISVTARRARILRVASDRAAADLRRPGGDRDRERAPVQRDQGGARAADRDCRDPARHQRLDRPTRSRCSTRSSRAARRAFRRQGGAPGDAARRHASRTSPFAADAVGPKGVGFLKPWPLDRGSGAGTLHPRGARHRRRRHRRGGEAVPAHARPGDRARLPLVPVRPAAEGRQGARLDHDPARDDRDVRRPGDRPRCRPSPTRP